MIDDSCRDGHWLLCWMRDLFIAKAPPSQHWKTPYISRHPSVWMWLPHATLFRDRMLQTFRAFVRLANRVVGETLAFGKPQQRLVMSSQGLGISRETVL